jgi:hypothetical protein
MHLSFILSYEMKAQRKVNSLWSCNRDCSLYDCYRVFYFLCSIPNPMFNNYVAHEGHLLSFSTILKNTLQIKIKFELLNNNKKLQKKISENIRHSSIILLFTPYCKHAYDF